MSVRIAHVVAPLWTVESLVERGLQLGKVQNLRIAARALDGTVIPVFEIFSFWKQVGRASRGKGYVEGRELREGCLIPAVGGGLCQLSNALYEAALQSGCEILERHAHSRVVPGSAAAQGKDATVAWNYVDLRFRPPQAIRIAAHLTGEELQISFWAAAKTRISAPPTPTELRVLLDPTAHTCTDCGAQSCFRHRVSESSVRSARTAYVLDELWPEFLDYVRQHANRNDVLVVPATGGRYGAAKDLALAFDTMITANCAAARRGWGMRRAYSVPERVRRQLAGSAALAESFAHKLPFDVEHLVVPQSLLPFLWKIGALGGRTYDVLLTRRPFVSLHQILDQAAERWPERSTLREYRAPEWMVSAEQEALTAAKTVITPHSMLARHFPGKVSKLGWILPQMQRSQNGEAIVFPGPTVARKGAFELREALQGTEHSLLPLGNELEGSDFWQGLRRAPDPQNDWLAAASIVVQPALIEDNPRPLLRAIAAGVSVLCTEECGVTGMPGVTIVNFGDSQSIRTALNNIKPEKRLQKPADFCQVPN